MGWKGEDNPKWKGGVTKKKKFCCDCGVEIDRRAKRCCVCAGKNRTGESNPFYGKRHTPETRKQMQISQQKRDADTRYDISKEANPERSSEMIKARWQAMTEREKEEYMAPFIKAGMEGCRRAKETKIENAINDILRGLGFEFERNTFIGKYNVDFLVEGDKIIECYGDYWHCNPRLFDGDEFNNSLKLTAFEKWEKDLKRQKVLESEGYSFISFWEHDIYEDIHLVKKEIEQFAQRKERI